MKKIEVNIIRMNTYSYAKMIDGNDYRKKLLYVTYVISKIRRKQQAGKYISPNY